MQNVAVFFGTTVLGKNASSDEWQSISYSHTVCSKPSKAPKVFLE